MKCIVIYFSQTGNTEKIARAIQTGVKQSAGHCDLARIEDANPRGLLDYDLIGIGSAVFGGQLGGVGIFMNNVQFVGGKHTFLFCTHGTSPDSFFPALYKKAQRKQMTVIGMGNWYGDCHLLHMPQPYPTAGHPDEIDLKEAERFGVEMVERSRGISGGQKNLIPAAPPEPPPMPPMPEIENTYKIVKSFPTKLKFHKEKCLFPECRLCMENCPMQGIDLTVDPPVVAKPCVGCEWCCKLCPSGALDMDEWLEAMIAATGEHLPKMMMPALEKAEKEGKFRRLIPVEKLKLNNFGYNEYKNHPQWIIGKGPQK